MLFYYSVAIKLCTSTPITKFNWILSLLLCPIHLLEFSRVRLSIWVWFEMDGILHLDSFWVGLGWPCLCRIMVSLLCNDLITFPYVSDLYIAGSWPVSEIMDSYIDIGIIFHPFCSPFIFFLLADMIPQLEFMVWTSLLFWSARVTVLAVVEGASLVLESSTGSQKMILWSGSRWNTRVWSLTRPRQ